MMRRLVGLLLVGMLAACSGDPDGEIIDEQEDELSAGAFKVLQHNIAGGINMGADAALDYVSDQARSTGPDVVMMEEVCESQFVTFKARFPKWDVRYSPMIAAEERCNNGPIGIVLASKWKMSDVTATNLGVAFGRQFTLLCADLAKNGVPAHGVRACATHLRAWDDAEAEPMRTKQTAIIHATLAKRITQKNQAVIVAGDFNAGPHREPLNNMYLQKMNGQLDGKGLFREADQNDKKFFGKDPMAPERKCAPNSCRSGQDTHGNTGGGGSKLDYVFFSTNRAKGSVAASVMGTGTSDHNLYRAAAELDLK